METTNFEAFLDRAQLIAGISRIQITAKVLDIADFFYIEDLIYFTEIDSNWSCLVFRIWSKSLRIVLANE